jgi:hypothetical protein
MDGPDGVQLVERGEVLAEQQKRRHRSHPVSGAGREFLSDS